ncbi:MAG: glycerol kinase GlpK, partial [Polyangiaceae bacterium]
SVRAKTGLVLDAYFSATKVAWILDHVDGARARADRGELAFGTIDSFLVHKLSDASAHVIDVTNASRTLLMDLATSAWDTELCAIFRVPPAMLPSIVGSAEIVARTRNVGFLPDGIPVAGIAGDQQAALFGQACFRQGDAKSTYGTGAFVLMNVGHTPIASRSGLVTTVAWRVGTKTTYALEGSAFIAGAAVQWLRDGLGLVASAAEIEALARLVPSTEGVSFVPALSGLGAPHWDPHARGTITGITRGTTKAHLARATLEGIGWQVDDLVRAMQADAGRPLTALKVDGGAAANDLLMQFQSDVSDVVVSRPKEIESTGRGAAMLAAVGSGLVPWDGVSEVPAALSKLVEEDRRFTPSMSDAERSARHDVWAKAVAAAKVH